MWTLAILATIGSTAKAQNTDDVRQQLQDLKKQYEQTTLEFQRRIADLEEKIDKKNPPTPEQASKSKAAEQATAVVPPPPPPVTGLTPAAATPTATTPAALPTTTTQNPAPAPQTGIAAKTARQVFLGESEEVGQKYQGAVASEPTIF